MGPHRGHSARDCQNAAGNRLTPAKRRRWRLPLPLAFVVGAAGVFMVAQACGGASGGADAAPTVTPEPTSSATSTPAGTTGGGDSIGLPPGGFGGGVRQALLNVAGASEEFAAFLGIPQAQLESELAAEGATPGSVAEAHARSREELSSFLIDHIETSLSEAVEAGSLPQGNVDNLLENLTSNVEAIIDGEGFGPGGGFTGGFGGGAGRRLWRWPWQGLLNVAGPSEEFAAFLGIPLDQLESELAADSATPGSVAGTHGRTRAQLEAFLIEQAEANLNESVAAGTLTQEAADNLLVNLESNIEGIIDADAFTPGGVGLGG